MSYQIKILAALAGALTLSSCSSAVKRVEYPITSSPSVILDEVDSDIQAALQTQVDVLDRPDLEMAQKRADKAREQIREQKSQEKVLATLGDARAYLNRANEIANGRRGEVDGILKARQAALAAGARQFPAEKKRLGIVDDDFRAVVGDRRVAPKDFSQLQGDYLDLELSSIQASQLNSARSRVLGAIDKNAKSFTPRTLNRAEIDLRNAENVIASHRHEPEAYKSAVDRANQSSQLLIDMAQKVRAGRAVLPESVALRLVLQERGLKSLASRLESSQAQEETNREQLSAQQQELARVKTREELDKAIADSRREFTREEADVFKDGDKLLIRLKGMNFPSGRAEIPAASFALLGHVKDAADRVDAEMIVIEGHTDSTGGERVNGPLSQKRAEAVANYLETNGISSEKIQAVGRGFKKPLASNKTREGRAQNRRVDVIITPSAVTSATSSM